MYPNCFSKPIVTARDHAMQASNVAFHLKMQDDLRWKGSNSHGKCCQGPKLYHSKDSVLYDFHISHLYGGWYLQNTHNVRYITVSSISAEWLFDSLFANPFAPPHALSNAPGITLKQLKALNQPWSVQRAVFLGGILVDQTNSSNIRTNFLWNVKTRTVENHASTAFPKYQLSLVAHEWKPCFKGLEFHLPIENTAFRSRGGWIKVQKTHQWFYGSVIARFEDWCYSTSSPAQRPWKITSRQAVCLAASSCLSLPRVLLFLVLFVSLGFLLWLGCIHTFLQTFCCSLETKVRLKKRMV